MKKNKPLGTSTRRINTGNAEVVLLEGIPRHWDEERRDSRQHRRQISVAKRVNCGRSQGRPLTVTNCRSAEDRPVFFEDPGIGGADIKPEILINNKRIKDRYYFIASSSSLESFTLYSPISSSETEKSLGISTKEVS